MGGAGRCGSAVRRALLKVLPNTPTRGRILNMRSIFCVGWAFVALAAMAGCEQVLGVEPWEDHNRVDEPDTDDMPMSSSSSSSSSSGAAMTCLNGVQDGTETGVDCGGNSCDVCHDGRGCSMDSDCLSNYCPISRGYCISLNGRDMCEGADPDNPNCADCTQNAAESDVDCGGDCLPCRAGKGCTNDGECWSGVCTNGACIAGAKGTRCFSNADCASGSCGTLGCPIDGACCQ